MLGVVYKITCLGTGRSYVGRTSNYNSRISVHFSHLRKGVHSSRLMQSDFNEYGIDSFVVEVLCKGCMEYMGNMESFMIRFYSPEYNSANVVPVKVDSSHGLLCRFNQEWVNRWGTSNMVVKDIEVDGGFINKIVLESVVEVKNVGRPRVELSAEVISAGEAMLEMGVSVSVMCRKLGIYRMQWYRHKKSPLR